MRRISAWGMSLVAAMQLIFVATGGDRGGVYIVVNVLGLVAAALIAWGFSQGSLGLVGGGFIGMAILRMLNVALDITRVPLWISLTMFASWIACGASALAWLADPAKPRERGLRMGLRLAGFAYFITALTTFSGGRLSALVAITLGTGGLLVTAAMVERSDFAPT